MNVKDVDISLSLGQLFCGPQWGLVAGLIILGLLFPIFTVIMLCTPIIFTTEMIVCIVSGNIICLCILIFAIYLIIKDYKLKSKVKLWLRDAVELEAFCVKTGEYKADFLPKGYTVDIEFTLGSTRYVRSCGIRTFGGKRGYLTTFGKYIGRTVNIAYSPGYDEVLILKERKNGTEKIV